MATTAAAGSHRTKNGKMEKDAAQWLGPRNCSAARNKN